MISGKIIPALATTTAAITGFIGVEIYKYLLGAALDSYRAASINLASNVFCCENLPDPQWKTSGLDQATQMQVVAVPEKFTVYDTVVIDKPDLTLQQFIDEFAAVHYGCVIDALYPMSGGAKPGTMLYNAMDAYDPSKKAALAAKLATPVTQLWEQVVGPVFPKERTFFLFDCTVETESGDPGIVPTIRYNFRK